MHVFTSIFMISLFIVSKAEASSFLRRSDSSICVYVCVCVCMYACMCVCMYSKGKLVPETLRLLNLYVCMYVVSMYVCMYSKGKLIPETLSSDSSICMYVCM